MSSPCNTFWEKCFARFGKNSNAKLFRSYSLHHKPLKKIQFYRNFSQLSLLLWRGVSWVGKEQVDGLMGLFAPFWARSKPLYSGGEFSPLGVLAYPCSSAPQPVQQTLLYVFRDPGTRKVQSQITRKEKMMETYITKKPDPPSATQLWIWISTET